MKDTEFPTLPGKDQDRGRSQFFSLARASGLDKMDGYCKKEKVALSPSLSREEVWVQEIRPCNSERAVLSA